MGRKKKFQSGAVLDAINHALVKHGVPPTVEELRHALGLGSARTVLRYLKELEDAKQIERWAGARGIRTLNGRKRGLETVPVPIVGQAPAGPLMVAEENVEGWVRMARAQLNPPSANFFLLRVRGDSMNRARVGLNQIEDGDLLLVRQQPTAENGDIVVAIIDGQATIKRFAQGAGYITLKPESTNSSHQPILASGNVLLNGIVCEVLKKGSLIFDSTVEG